MEFTRYPTSRNLSSELSKKTLRPVYLFIGEEEGEKDKFIQQITGMIFKDPEAARNYTGRFHAEMDEILNAADFALSGSMFSDRKLCILRNIEALQAVPDGQKLFREMVAGLAGGTCLVMTSAENRPPKFLSRDELDNIGVYHFWKPFEKDLAPYIINGLKKEGIDIDTAAAGFLVELVGRDMQKIDEALEKLKYFSGSGAITREILGEVIAEERDVSLFEFMDALFRKNRRALHLLKKLIENNYPPLLILNQVMRRAEQIERYHHLVGEGRSAGEAVQMAGVTEKNKNDFFEYIKLNTHDGIRKLNHRFYQTDYALKSSRESRSLLSNPLFDLATGMLLQA
jgi:DNA polymerase III delta subunit